MFDLNQSIAEWRRQMLAAGIKTPVPLEELESHLRDDMEQQMKSGLEAKAAFEIASQRIGQASALKSEFKKVERTFMKKITIILTGIFVMFIGAGFILPALAKYRDLGVWTGEQVGFFSLGVASVIVGLSATAFGFKKRRA